MPTVGKPIADRIVKGNGLYPGDHVRVVKIVEYDNAFGGVSYGLEYEGMRSGAYRESEFVRNPRTYWQAEGRR